MLDCVSVPYSNYANLVSSVLDAREVWLVLDSVMMSSGLRIVGFLVFLLRFLF